MALEDLRVLREAEPHGRGRRRRLPDLRRSLRRDLRAGRVGDSELHPAESEAPMTGKEKETFDEYMRRTASWGVYIENTLLRKALSTIKHYPTAKALFFFLEKRVVVVHKNRRGPARYEVDYTAEIGFSYDEAVRRGIPRNRFARAIRELHAAGYIDIVYIGSGSIKDASRYRLSKRWRTGESLPIPVRKRPQRRDEKCLVRDEKGKWVRAEEISQVRKPLPVQGTNHVLEESPQGTNRVLENDRFPISQVRKPPTNLKTYQTEDADLDGAGPGRKVKDNGVESDRAPSRRDEAAPSIPSNGLSELLSHLPPDKQEMIINLVQKVNAGELLPSRARTKVLMPRYVPLDVAHILFPDPLKYGLWGPLEDRLAARSWT